MMQHVQAENVGYAARPERKLLCVGDGIEPGAPDEVCRDNVWRELFEKTGTSANFNGNSVLFSESEQSREKLVLVDAPQDGFLLPNPAVSEKLLVSLRIDGHCVISIVLSSAPASRRSSQHCSVVVIKRRPGGGPVTNPVARLSRRNGTRRGFDRLV